ncbi:hypothetical protein [Bifidobacterium asteroides]|uniref:Uncharacterized protein n=1 Tax=Bifidobacterium asteroides TaxID=1684 RepID=A0ABS3IU56_9BIFI|nr:hypothetical protein [Bifidobacterium asteroides]MCP8613662.1 hypothetical protein [Bifidobacterium asteroides]
MAVSILPARLIAVSFATAGSEAGMATPATLGNVRQEGFKTPARTASRSAAR